MLVWNRIREAIEGQGSAALVSVMEVAGSAPREPGARLVVRPDGGFWGTVGGGALEWSLLEEARRLLASGPAAALARDWPLGPELGQCCGGRVTTLVETFGADDLPLVSDWERHEDAGPFRTATRLVGGVVSRQLLGEGDAEHGPTGSLKAGGVVVEPFGETRTPVLLFGAGHVGRALALALAPLPFRLRWVDTRADAFPALIPAHADAVRTDTPEAEVAAAPAGAFALVMTHSHPLDLALTRAALARGDLGGVGLIGSASKKVRFLKRLREAGLSEAALSRLTCPIGVPGISGKEPAIIAASVAAQLLQWRESARASAQDLRPLQMSAAMRSRARRSPW